MERYQRTLVGKTREISLLTLLGPSESQRKEVTVFLWKVIMTSIAVRSAALISCLMCLVISGPAHSGRSGRQNSANTDLIAHEWGTFTSIAGRNGQAVEWSPGGGATDLPSFVEHVRTADFKGGLRGTVRMETPVLYFYSPTETTVSVNVSFAGGVITEWYPHASHVEPNPKNVLSTAALLGREQRGSIEWNAVTVSPGLPDTFPQDQSENHYYAARETAATAISVKTRKGIQTEKFLFYRGVSTFAVPVAAQPISDGKVLIRNLGTEDVPQIILFERRGDKLGYRLAGPLQHQTALEAPELTSTVESIGGDLEEVLIARGLYPDEARAMVQTWKQSWFEEGYRLFYIIPPQFVNAVLPLSIAPAPAQINRVFVGRVELITPATEQAVETALAEHDGSIITRYGRFLEPILNQLREEHPDRAMLIDRQLGEIYTATPNPAAK